jgi:hypothetical protein
MGLRDAKKSDALRWGLIRHGDYQQSVLIHFDFVFSASLRPFASLRETLLRFAADTTPGLADPSGPV